MTSGLPSLSFFAVGYTAGASLTGALLAYAKRMRLGQREGHSYALDKITAKLGLMSQSAYSRLVGTTAPHASGYFFLSRSSPRNYISGRC